MVESRLQAQALIPLLRQAGILRAVQGRQVDAQWSRYTTDSRSLKDGDLFLAYKGVHFDAHDLIDSLLDEKPQCGLIVDQETSWAKCQRAPWSCLVTDTREAWAWIAAEFYGHPQQKLKLIGITGTNGKTSTVWFLKQILAALGESCLTLGTLGVYLGEHFFPATHTTPDPDDTFRYLAKAVSEDIPWAVMEVSSHALVQKRLSPLRFDAVGFTSFSRDHLDFHATMEEYFAAKWQLIDHYRKAEALAWLSQSLGPVDAQQYPQVHCRSYGPLLEKDDSLAYHIHAMELASTELSLKLGAHTWRGRLNFAGDFAVENFALAWGIVHSLTGRVLDPQDWCKIAAVPGRFEPVVPASMTKFAVIVDYAHTPDALEKTLIKLKSMTVGQVWVVFGCGGDRDKGKRPMMGRVAELHADRLVLTSDNPRTEEPQSILSDIAAGLLKPDDAHLVIDRGQAIAYAIQHAQPGDSILIAGKGHEDYQIIGKQKLVFDDKQVALALLAANKA